MYERRLLLMTRSFQNRDSAEAAVSGKQLGQAEVSFPSQLLLEPGLGSPQTVDIAYPYPWGHFTLLEAGFPTCDPSRQQLSVLGGQ